MTVEISIPKIGVNVTEVRLVEWKAKEGQWVEEGSVVLVIETEKTEWSVETVVSGFLHILVKEGDKAQIEEVVGLLAETKDELEELQKESPQEILPLEVETKESPLAESTSVKAETVFEDKAKKAGSVRISPIARKMAREHMLDITQIKGTGPGGRIVREDIEKSIQEQKKKEVPSVETPPEQYQGRRIKKTIPLKGMRQSIAEHMYRSLSTSAQMTVMGELDVTELVRFRETLVNREETLGVRISYIDLLVFILAKALKDHFTINCSLIDNEVKVWDDINIGVAIALGEEGLIVPVVKNADQKSLVEISKTIKMLTQKAQAKTLVPDEVTGGTFTLTTVGRKGESRFQTPILNQPEAAILGVGPIEERAVVRDGQIVIRPIMPYSLTFDHRAINGFGAEQFMGKIREFVENPDLLLL
jgi:pyruvate dehydrogenase E2 component (dihydrolipoamide acetyltransferase)